jgi:hypothetical protein
MNQNYDDTPWVSLEDFITTFPHLDARTIKKWCSTQLLTSKVVEGTVYISMDALEDMRSEFERKGHNEAARNIQHSFLDGSEFTQRSLADHTLLAPKNVTSHLKVINYRSRSKIK